jgi:hypothetical protein
MDKRLLPKPKPAAGTIKAYKDTGAASSDTKRSSSTLSEDGNLRSSKVSKPAPIGAGYGRSTSRSFERVAPDYKRHSYWDDTGVVDISSTLVQPLLKPDWMSDAEATSVQALDIETTDVGSKIMLLATKLQIYHGFCAPLLRKTTDGELHELRNHSGHITWAVVPSDVSTVKKYMNSDRVLSL